MAINCGAIPETLLESQLFGHVKGSFTGADRDHDGFCRQAEGGTIFLDEIGETPHAIQVKLLRMLQEREIYPVGSSKAVKTDLRVITATNRNLDVEVAEKRFRADLFYRLNVIPIELPPLRDRQDDIPLLVDHFLKAHCGDYPGTIGQAVEDDAMQALYRYDWPGNVRELENALQHALVLRGDGPIGVAQLPPEIAATGRPAAAAVLGRVERGSEDERELLRQALDAERWHRGRTARRLGIDRTTLWRKMREHDLTPPDQTGAP